MLDAARRARCTPYRLGSPSIWGPWRLSPYLVRNRVTVAPVRLKLAKRGTVGGFTVSYCSISVKVQNIGFAKNVVAVYTPDGAIWKEHPLHFTRTYGTYDLFEHTIFHTPVPRFVVRYRVAGQTYFDNNDGCDYRLGGQDSAIGGSVVVSRATCRHGVPPGGYGITTWLDGELLVSNLSYAKTVGIRMSVDGGITWLDTLATFAGTRTDNGVVIGPHVEVWRFTTPQQDFNQTSPRLRFAAFYRLGRAGPTFWDNNFGQDYRVDNTDDATVG